MRVPAAPMRVAGVLFLLLAASGCLSDPAPEATPAAPVPPATVAYDAIRFDTDAGAFIVILYNASAPETVALMKTYVAEGYYVGRGFYRTVPGHVIQVTDAAGGATDDARRVPLETSSGFHFSAGAVGIARGAEPDSGGPEFFVMDYATSHLDGNYTVWGQVVDGLAVVRVIARGPAFDFGTLPSQLGPAEPTDRMALQPVLIRSTTLLRSVQQEGTYPMQVARNLRLGEFRHSMDWPARLVPGQAADLTWYMRPYNDTAPPDAQSVRIRIDGTDLPLAGTPDVPGVYHFTWTPADLAPRNATLVANGQPVATLTIRPQAPAAG